MPAGHSVAPGRAPRAPGHRVALLINGCFGPLVRRLGFAAASPVEARLFEQALRDPDLRHPRRGPDCAPGATVRVGGRLVAPVGGGVQELVVITRNGRRLATALALLALVPQRSGPSPSPAERPAPDPDVEG